MVTVRLKGYLGNQLFQIFTAIAYAVEHGIEFHIPINSSPANAFPTYLHLPNKYFDSTLPGVVVTEPDFAYKPLPFNESWRSQNIVLDGYFQSFKYFEKHKRYLLNLLPFAIEYKANFKCSIHFRGGDYKRWPTKHPIVTKEYLTTAIRIMKGFGIDTFVFHSDDIEYCRDFVKDFHIVNTYFEFLEGLTQIQELEIISECDHNICANSTFSLMASWLNRNPNKIVIQPRNWFGPDYSHHNTKDLYLPEAILV